MAHVESASDEKAVLFFDVDGTLIDTMGKDDLEEAFTAARPSDAVQDAFRRLHERGHKTFICTGRPRDLLDEPVRALNTTGIISSAGACVTIDGELVQESFIPEDVMIETIERLTEGGASVLLEGSRGTVVLAPDGSSYVGFADLPTAYSVDEVRAVVPDLTFCKFSYMDVERENVMRLYPYLKRFYTNYDLGVGFGEFCPIGVHKGSGIAHALDILGHSKANTYAFGDSENDLPMFPSVETPVAMGNALPSVKEAAAYVTDSVADDGVVTAMEHFGLI